jgi:uncharacterized protein (TIGR00661 family)
MFFSGFNEKIKQPVVLVAPLDWGLGHATRCIPLIKELLACNCQVLLAAEGAGAALLQQEFPQLQCLPLAGYRIHYARQGKLLPIKMLLQAPKILYRIYTENHWLKKTVRKYQVDAVISDNRLGLYHNQIPCIYITHQLAIQTGTGYWNRVLQSIHYHFIKKFQRAWVPDTASTPGFAGQLSHPTALPANIEYIGCLSRFKKMMNAEIKYDLLVLLSGPEPQRSIFEALLLKQLKTFKGKVLLVRGLPGKTQILQATGIDIKNHLTAQELGAAICSTNMIICRSGYTTIMDLLCLGKKAILVPTPGQTEQEYLAKYLVEKKIFYSHPQKGFSLMNSLQAAANFEYDIPVMDMAQYKTQVQQFVASL